MTRLTAVQARAAADTYGWSVLLHDNGGFLAQRGRHHLIVTFAEDGSFQHAAVREGLNGPEAFLTEGDVVPKLARHGATLARPVSGEEQSA
jgi:hypothetical protein